MDNLEKFADSYGRGSTQRADLDVFFFKLFYETIKRDFVGKRILEMGYGDGVVTEMLIEDFGKSYVIEGSKTLVGAAKRRHGESVEVYHSYFEDFIPVQSFETVYCSFVLEHVDDPVFCLKCAASWLVPGGRLLILVPNANSYHREVGVLSGFLENLTELTKADHAMGHKRIYTPESMEKDIEAAGLIIHKNENLLFKPFHYGILRHCNERELIALMTMGEKIPNNRRGILYYVVGL